MVFKNSLLTAYSINHPIQLLNQSFTVFMPIILSFHSCVSHVHSKATRRNIIKFLCVFFIRLGSTRKSSVQPGREEQRERHCVRSDLQRRLPGRDEKAFQVARRYCHSTLEVSIAWPYLFP